MGIKTRFFFYGLCLAVVLLFGAGASFVHTLVPGALNNSLIDISTNHFFSTAYFSNSTAPQGLGGTNMFEARPTNSAANPPALGIGTNGVVYIGNSVWGGGSNGAVVVGGLIYAHSNIGPNVASMANGDWCTWSSNGSSVLLIKKNQAGLVFTNVLGTAAQ